ncbi:MAG: hypothetical protein CMP63_03550 [Flavobacteriales bacterium]|nr:hypothetical protein [Flavobacteriales bacterium]|tara:strand:+ start:15289 stop:16014 length:726 start_codon:yes stop_codon:yes gene_type:complete
MSSFLEVIQQLKTNQKAINTNLAKIESLGGSVNKSLLRELIQDARELHEGSVILSYVLFDEQNKKSEQLEIQLQEKEPLPEVSNSVEVEHEIEEGFNEALEYTQAEKPKIEKDRQTIDDIPSHEEIVEQLENEITSAISSNSSGLLYDSQEEEDNSLAAKLARKKIENLNSAIGINEKFLFTNELFDGNTEQFLKTIEELNNCVSLTEAKDKLTEVAQKRSWLLDEEPYQKLQSLLSRKYQ